MKYKGYEIKQQNHQISQEETERRIAIFKEYIDTMKLNSIEFSILYSHGFIIKTITK